MRKRASETMSRHRDSLQLDLEGLAVLGIWDTAGALSGLQVDAPFRVGIVLSNVAWHCKWLDDSIVRWPLLRSTYGARRQ